MNYTIMVLAAYAVIMIAATVLMTNKEKSVERFCVGNRNTGSKQPSHHRLMNHRVDDIYPLYHRLYVHSFYMACRT